VAESIAFEIRNSWNVGWEVLFAGVPRSLNDMFGMEYSGFRDAVFFRSLDNDSPLLFRCIPARLLDSGTGPDIELEQLGIHFKEVC